MILWSFYDTNTKYRGNTLKTSISIFLKFTKYRKITKYSFLTLRYSRHPNFFGELSMWWTIYMFTLNNSNFHLVNYSIAGAVILQLIFLKSTPLTERISQSKYPTYSEYQAQVSRIIPGWSSLKFKTN